MATFDEQERQSLKQLGMEQWSEAQVLSWVGLTGGTDGPPLSAQSSKSIPVIDRPYLDRLLVVYTPDIPAYDDLLLTDCS